MKTAEGITVRRADKTPALVLINTAEYHQKLDTILADETKFKKITRNPVDEIKREANRTIERVNALATNIKLSTIKGDYEPGYIYGNVKTHKPGNPLRPIISQVPAPTYRLAKHLNALLTPYIPTRYRVQSSTDFLRIVRSATPEGTIASLDVESLFTNVPVEETIGLICDRVYRDVSTPNLNIPEGALRDLLRLCTMKAPFITHKGEMYTQIDGIAMGSPLGVLFADFYMGVVEERVFEQCQEPDMYCRYVDDTFIKADTPEEVEHLRQKFEECSSLRFTCERSDNGNLPFLDIQISQGDGDRFVTKVYKKPTNMGLCLNGSSECPDRYRRSVINAYIRRALTHCSTWAATTKEIDDATQVLVNNGFSNREIMLQIRKTIDKWYLDDNTATLDVDRSQENIKLFYRNYWHIDYKKDEKALRNIISSHVKPINVNDKISLVIYYKNKKTSNLILKNSPSLPTNTLKRNNVVYLFRCPIVRCNHEYIGLTTMKLSKRISCHAQEGNIFNHFKNAHSTRLTTNMLRSSFEIIDHNPCAKRLRYLEALHILEKKPSLNATQEQLLLPSIIPPPRRLVER